MSVRHRKWVNPKTGEKTGHWFIDVKVKDHTGKVVRVRDNSPINTKRGAEEFEREIRAAVVDGTYGKAVVQAPTFETFKTKFMEFSLTNNGRSTYAAKEGLLKNHLSPHFGTFRLDEITSAKIEAYKALKTRDGLSRKTVNTHLSVLGKLLSLAKEWGELNTTVRVKLLKLPHQSFEFLSFDEAPRFLAKAPAQWSLFVTTAMHTGLRVGELLGLKWDDIDLRAGQLVVRRNLWGGEDGSPKSGKFRNVPLPESLRLLLKENRHLKGDYVFCRDDGRQLTHSRVKNVVPSICKAAGLAKRLTMHDLRHTYASHLVMKGVSIKMVQELLGHATITMTMRYAHLSQDSKNDAVKVLDEPYDSTPKGRNRGTRTG